MLKLHKSSLKQLSAFDAKSFEGIEYFNIEKFKLIKHLLVSDMWYLEMAGRLQLLFTSSFMTIVLVSCYNDFFLFVIKEFDLDRGTPINHHCNVTVSA